VPAARKASPGGVVSGGYKKLELAQDDIFSSALTSNHLPVRLRNADSINKVTIKENIYAETCYKDQMS